LASVGGVASNSAASEDALASCSLEACATAGSVRLSTTAEGLLSVHASESATLASAKVQRRGNAFTLPFYLRRPATREGTADHAANLESLSGSLRRTRARARPVLSAGETKAGSLENEE
jgi:hypothetical protein